MKTISIQKRSYLINDYASREIRVVMYLGKDNLLYTHTSHIEMIKYKKVEDHPLYEDNQIKILPLSTPVIDQIDLQIILS